MSHPAQETTQPLELQLVAGTGPAPTMAARGGLVLKLTLAFAATLLALEATLLIIGHGYWQEVLQQQIHAHLGAVAASRSEMVASGIKLLRQQVELSTQRGEFRRLLVASQTGTVAELDWLNSQKRIDGLVDGKTCFSAGLVDRHGKVLLANNPAVVGTNVSASGAFQRGLTDSCLGRPRQVGGRVEALSSAPVRDRDTSVGVLMLLVNAAALAEPLRKVGGLGESGEVMLMLRDTDAIRYLLPPREQAELSSVPLGQDLALEDLLAKSDGFRQMRDYRGRSVLAASSATGYELWSVVAKMDEAEAYAPIARALQMCILYGTLVAAAGTVATFALARRLARPLRRLSDAAARVAGGDYRGQVPVTSADELGALSASFNEMTAAIRARGAERDGAEAALRLADRRKDDFLAILGHELRNPVAAITAGVQMWKEAEGDAATAKLVQDVIHRQGGNLKRLVDDLLDVARITTGKVELHRGPVNVAEMITHAVDAARPFIEERRHQLIVSLATGAPPWIDADSTRIEQVLTNLLTNSAKYTPDGGRLAVAERIDGDCVEIAVSDNGIGLTPDVLEHVFDLFTQADSSLHRTSGGLGIGLSLSRQLVELHGGTLTAQSEGLERGAIFTVRLPTIAAPAPAELRPAAASATGPGRRILLVDDNRDTTRLLSRLLGRRGHDVRVAYDGRTGLQAAQDFQPEVFILDIGLPEIDGYELARRFRAEGFTENLIIALSGYAQENDRARAREAGFDHHFAKPVDLDVLASLIVEARGTEGQEAREAASRQART